MLEARFKQGAHLCVGLDPTPDDGRYSGDMEWLENLVDMTSFYAAAYKPNLQFYLHWGSAGIKMLGEIIDYIRKNHPDIPIILDAKWGDIGATNIGSRMLTRRLGVDATTIHNYMGMEAMQPLLDELFCFVLCKTSNPGSNEFQGDYLNVAFRVNKFWDQPDKPGAGLVVGATYPEQLRLVNDKVDNCLILVPGVGAQGGTIKDVFDNILGSRVNTALVNVSSGIGKAANPAEAALRFNHQIVEAKYGAL